MNGTLLSTCDFVPAGNGLFRAVPRQPKEKVTAKEAARLLSRSLTHVYRLIRAGFVASERVSPRRVLIPLDSLHAHVAAVQAGGFWTPERVAAYEKQATVHTRGKEVPA